MSYNELTQAQKLQVAQLFGFQDPAVYLYDVGTDGKVQGAREMSYPIICAACNRPIEGDDLEDRHWGHEEGCPNRAEPDSVDCDCDLEYHADCCPDCRARELVVAGS